MLRTAVRRAVPARARAWRRRGAESRAWAARGYAPPSPEHVKRLLLLRNGAPNATWIESGTYLGDTAAFLSIKAMRVYTIEPDEALFTMAQRRFAGSNGEVRRGLSEDVFPALLLDVAGDVNLWLDGHFSGGLTHRADVPHFSMTFRVPPLLVLRRVGGLELV